MLKIIEFGLAERDKQKIGLKWPLAKAKIGVIEEPSTKLNNLILEQLNVKKSIFTKSKNISVEFDTNLTPELEAEGYAREMSRKVQVFRKNLGLNQKNLIELNIIADKDFVKILEKNKEFIMERTNSKSIKITTKKETFKNKTDFKIKDKKGFIGIKKVD